MDAAALVLGSVGWDVANSTQHRDGERSDGSWFGLSEDPSEDLLFRVAELSRESGIAFLGGGRPPCVMFGHVFQGVQMGTSKTDDTPGHGLAGRGGTRGVLWTAHAERASGRRPHRLRRR
ncbi:hypothetical protein BH24CHL8_BH24CHL8_09350 [soil metagenome]